MKIYKGLRTEMGCVVTVGDLQLNPRVDLFNHSPDGFEWGYRGSGPAQLALALCADLLKDDAKALEVYQSVKNRFVANIDIEHWAITSSALEDIIQYPDIVATRIGEAMVFVKDAPGEH